MPTLVENEVKAATVNEVSKMLRFAMAFFVLLGPVSVTLWTAAEWKRTVDMSLEQLNKKVDWLVEQKKVEIDKDGYTARR